MAKKKDSKVSITSVDRVIKKMDGAVVPVHIEVDGAELDFEVKKALDLNTFYAMVQYAVNVAFVFDESTGAERYDAFYHDFAIGTALLIYVANFKPEMASDKFYQLMQCESVMDHIYEIWSEEQYKSFCDAVNRQINYRKEELLAAERRKLQDATEQLIKGTNAFEQFVKMFEGVDPAQLMEEMQKITNMDEERLGRSVVNARDEDFVEMRRAELRALK